MARMTLNEFIRGLAKFRGRARLRSSGAIRCDGQCPIDMMGGDWLMVGGRLGLTQRAVDLIIGAADNYGGKSVRTRARMLKALGLTDVKTIR